VIGELPGPQERPLEDLDEEAWENHVRLQLRAGRPLQELLAERNEALAGWWSPLTVELLLAVARETPLAAADAVRWYGRPFDGNRSVCLNRRLRTMGVFAGSKHYDARTNCETMGLFARNGRCEITPLGRRIAAMVGG
jgi:hypothetical protein